MKNKINTLIERMLNKFPRRFVVLTLLSIFSAIAIGLSYFIVFLAVWFFKIILDKFGSLGALSVVIFIFLMIILVAINYEEFDEMIPKRKSKDDE